MALQPALNEAQVAGASFHYAVAGHGVPVVFVHGAIADHRYWSAQFNRVSAVARCYALDQRYFGSWQWPEDGPPYGIMNHAADLSAFIQEVVGEPAHVVATSYGGGVAIAMAVSHPTWVRSLCLHEPALTSFLGSEGHRAVIANERIGLAPVAAAVAAGQVPSALRLFVDWTKEAAGVFDELPTQAQQVLLDNAHTLRRHMSAQPATVTFEQVQTLNMPMTLLCGEESRRYFRLLVEALHDCLPRSTVVELPAANHLAPVEQSELFTQHVLAHLAHHIDAAA